ncbi:MAG: DUF364 domain-containing protein [Deltaproteobacteria bacterium]|jgi:uncharacterized protein (DUF4213/DUF364 family)|nr:DUF364 domain-containing protein [Deltaproteobacteria bacterium]
MIFTDKWLLYQALIDSVAPDIRIATGLKSLSWALLQTDGLAGAGLAHFLPGSGPGPGEDQIIGQKARDLAQLIFSWDNADSCVGLAAINAALATQLPAQDNPNYLISEGNAFDFFLPRVQGRKVGVIGHFLQMDRLIETAGEISIFERNPLPGDYPDTAVEYLLPSQEVVFMTGTTIINKTAPRLLELAAGAEIYLVGPSVPLCPALFELGFTGLSGTVVKDYPALALNLRQSNKGHFGFDKKIIQRINMIKRG